MASRGGNLARFPRWTFVIAISPVLLLFAQPSFASPAAASAPVILRAIVQPLNCAPSSLPGYEIALDKEHSTLSFTGDVLHNMVCNYVVVSQDKPTLPQRVGAGTLLTGGMSLRTDADGRAALVLSMDGGAEVRIGVDGKSEVKIGRFCKDAAGRVKLELLVDDPGKILVNVTSPNENTAPLDFTILTPTTKGKSLRTRHMVAVDDRWTTTVAGWEGVVVSDPDGANGAQVGAGSQIAIPTGRSPNQSAATARTISVDPLVEGMLPPLRQPQGAPPAPLAKELSRAFDFMPLAIGLRVVLVAMLGLIAGLVVMNGLRAHPPRTLFKRPAYLPERGNEDPPHKPTDLPE